PAAKSCAAAPPRNAIRTTALIINSLIIVCSPRGAKISDLLPPALFDHHPCRLQQRERDEANHRRDRHEQWIVHFPEEENCQRRHRDESGQPIADCDLSEQNAGAQDRSDRRAISALYEALDIRIASVTQQKRGGHQHEDEGREKDSDRRDERSPKTGDQIANKGRGDHHRAGADHSDRNSDEKLAQTEAAIPSQEPMLEEGYDHKATAEGERTSFEEEE